MSAGEAGGVACGGCGREVDDFGTEAPTPRQPCPTCGSLSRAYGLDFEAGLTLRASLGITHVRGATGRIAKKQSVGDDQSHDGSWVDRTQVFNFEDDRYVEKIVGADGAVLRDVDHPLSEHVGRGSDRADLREARTTAKVTKAVERAARKALRDEEFRRTRG
jgi:hypothetical protein